MRRRARTLIGTWFDARTLALLGAFCASGVHAATISLRASARVDAETPITLGEIASLKGEEAEDLAEAPIVSSIADEANGRAWLRIEVADVRAALDAAGVNWGRVALRGSACTARIGFAPTPQAEKDEGRQRDERMGPVDLGGAPTIRRHVAATLVKHFGVPADDLRLRFSSGDRDLLERRTHGRRVEVQPLGLGSLTPVRIRAYEGERVVMDESLRVEAQVQRDVIVASVDLRRNESLSGDDLERAQLWLDPAERVVASLDEAVGKRTRRRVDAGEALTPEALESPIVVRRGEVIHVRCLSGGIVLTAKARALDDARAGERIELRLDASERPFLATIDERGRAVVNLDAGPAPALREQRR